MSGSVYKTISEDIIRMLESGELMSGAKIPSVSDIRRKYNVSHITALKALKKLALEKFIRFEPGKGYFAGSGDTARINGIVACLIRPSWETNDRDNYFNDINQAIENKLMENAFSAIKPWCCRFLMNHHPSEEMLEQIKRKAAELDPSVDGFLLDERIPDNVISELKNKLLKPLVIVNRKSGAGVDTVSPDNLGGARTAVEICLKMGYKKFLVGNVFADVVNHEERTAGFLEALSKAGISDKNIICFEISRRPYEEEFAPMEKHIGGPEKTMIFSPIDYFARWAADTLAARGVVFGDKVGVMGFDSMTMASVRRPLLATMDVSASKIGAMAADTIIGNINKRMTAQGQNYSPEAVFKMGETL
jgi:DNA-binding LacI/PurR family transcriptional regulator